MHSRCQTARGLIRVMLLLAAVQIMGASAFAQEEMSPPASASPAPQASPTPSLERQFFKNLLRDQRAIWTSPLHVSKRDARWLIPLSIATGALIATDAETADIDDAHRNRINNVSRDISYIGSVYGTAAITGTFYLVGRAKNNARARETGLLGAQALLNGHIVTLALKTATQRPRPREKDGRGEFFDGGRSFPSGHAIMSWSLATVIAEEYRDRPVVRFSAYGLAAAVSIARYTGRSHFLSDVLVGSAIGYGIGRYVYRTHHNPNLDSGGEGMTNDTAGSRLTPLIIPSYNRQARAYGLTLAWSF
jgi:membrane-associated phospholipid phosphatase